MTEEGATPDGPRDRADRASRGGGRAGGLAAASLRSSLGGLEAVAGPDGLRRVSWRGEAPPDAGAGGDDGRVLEARATPWPGDGAAGAASRAEAVAVAAVRQLVQYLAGERREFDLPLDPEDLTSFRRRVLLELSSVPYGATISYGELAARCDRAGAARAVGNAVGRNPLPLVLPCHRVIRSDGSPGGYGGGRRRKRALLRLEARAGA